MIEPFWQRLLEERLGAENADPCPLETEKPHPRFATQSAPADAHGATARVFVEARCFSWLKTFFVVVLGKNGQGTLTEFIEVLLDWD